MPIPAKGLSEQQTYGVCPECGISLEGQNVERHADYHWPSFLPEAALSRLAKARRDELLNGGVSATDYRKDEERLG